MGKRLLVTGGAGFMGSNFAIEALNGSIKYDLTILDSLTYAANLENLQQISGEFEFVHGDIRDQDLMEKLARNNEIIVNFAAETHNDNSLIGPDIFIETNIIGTYNLLKSVRKYDSRFHQVSTDEVFGDLPIDSNDTFTENSPYKPSSPYSASKASADLLVKAWVRSFNIKATISHSSNNFGENQYEEKFIPHSIKLLRQNLPIQIYGNGLNVRDWVYVRDHSRALLRILEKGLIGEEYNIGARQLKSNLEVAKLLIKSFGKDENFIEFVSDRLGHDRKYSISPAKIETSLDWVPVGPSLEHWISRLN
jgi:dTDP-glucose 4,6-dehydratase